MINIDTIITHINDLQIEVVQSDQEILRAAETIGEEYAIDLRSGSALFASKTRGDPSIKKSHSVAPLADSRQADEDLFVGEDEDPDTELLKMIGGVEDKEEEGIEAPDSDIANRGEKRKRSSSAESIELLAHGTVSKENQRFHVQDHWFMIPGSPIIHLSNYLGSEWEHFINELYHIPPLETPPHMLLQPHDYQLKGAGQLAFLCRSRFGGGLCGDPPGLGKTLEGILLVYEFRNEPGFSLIVAPASIISTWVRSIEGTFEEGHGLSVLVLNDSHISAHYINAKDPDLVICSYEFVETASRKYRVLRTDLMMKTGALDLHRVNSPLENTFWEAIGKPVKLMILDEAHVVNKRNGLRHLALKRIKAKATVCLTGTMAHNKWHNVSGMVDFLASHPFDSHTRFLRAFCPRDSNGRLQSEPNEVGLAALQRFLMAFLIARPSKLLKLPPCGQSIGLFSLSADDAKEVKRLTSKYRQLMGLDNRNSTTSGDPDSAGEALGLAVQAQLLSCHPLLKEHSTSSSSKKKKGDHEETEISDDPTYLIEEENGNQQGRDSTAKDGRQKWLQLIKNSSDLLERSARLRAIIHLLRRIRKKTPEKKIVIFSQYVRFLDIIAEALQRDNEGVLRFDGTVDSKWRQIVQDEFASNSDKMILLITAGAGGLGLNITAANVVFITERWWNKNAEKQAMQRVWRQGQEQEVWCVKFQGNNSEICHELEAVQSRKDFTNQDLMAPLIRSHNRRPRIPAMMMQAPLDPPEEFKEWVEARLDQKFPERPREKRSRLVQDDPDDDAMSLSSGGSAGGSEMEYTACQVCDSNEGEDFEFFVCDGILDDGMDCPNTSHIGCEELDWTLEEKWFCFDCRTKD